MFNNLVANCGLVRLLFETLGELYTDIYLFTSSFFSLSYFNDGIALPVV